MAYPFTPIAAILRRPFVAYGLAVAISVLTLIVRISLDPWLGDRPLLILYVLPIIFSAYIGGLWPGMVSTAICALGVQHFYLAKAHNLLYFEGSASLWAWVMLMVDGALLSLLLEAMHRSRRRIETAGRLHSESQALYHSLVDQMPAGVFRKDAAGRYVYVNSYFCQLRGLTADRFLGKLPSELPESEAPFKIEAAEHHEQIMLTGKTVEVMDEYHRTDGHTLFFQVLKTPVYDGDGKIVGSQGILFDVTDRKQAERAVEARERLLRQVIDLVPHFIFAKDRDSRILFANRAFGAAAGLTAEQMAGRSDIELVGDQKQAEAFVRDDREVIESGRPKLIPEEKFTRKDGLTRILETAKMPFTMPGKNEPAVLGVAVDITLRKKLEDELRAVGERMKFYMNRMPLAFIAWDRQFRVAEWNATAEDMFGWTAREAIGRHAFDLIVPPDLQPQITRIWELIINTNSTSSHSINENITRDGRRITCEWRNAPWHDAKGQNCGCLCIISDITEKKRAEEKFAREQARFKLIVDTVPVGIAFHTTHADGASTRIVNHALLRICGITRSQHDEPGIYERISHPEDRGLCRQFDQEIQDGVRKQYSLEQRFVHPNGKVVWINLTYQREIYPDGTCEELTTIADITEHKEAEHRSQQLAFIVESSGEAIIGCDLSGTITSWNRGAETVFGYAAAEAVGKSTLLLYPPDRTGEQPDILARIGRGESLANFQTERLRKDGKRIQVSASISPLRDARGTVVGAATITRDITRQQMLEEHLRQSQKMEAIGQLAGGVAHDFNNILAIIQMQAELSRLGGSTSEERLTSLDEIQTAANRGANLTRQLLLFSRRQRPQPREIDLSDSITAMTKMLRRILSDQIQIQLKYAPQPLIVQADAGMLDQVLMNLTLNSRDAMPNGGQLVIETAAVDIDDLAALQSLEARPGSFARLSVSDSGSGITPEVLPRIYEPFFTTKDVGKGTGLGLATVFSIVQQHQGWIEVASEPGCGTSFHIYLPRVATPSAPPAEAALPATTVNGGSETILLVEDDDAVRGSIRRCLSQLGYQLLEAASAAAALQTWQQHRDRIDLLLTDLIMPGGQTGKELGEQLQQEKPALKVIYVSGYSADIFTRDVPQAPGVTFLAKPFRTQALAESVRAALDKK